eukprot:CCRYP_020670-RC/>CCRYP_020670-RC protein AED:0.48 eAED:1.00 QI:0/0/0/1/0/0/2/0/81
MLILQSCPYTLLIRELLIHRVFAGMSPWLNHYHYLEPRRKRPQKFDTDALNASLLTLRVEEEGDLCISAGIKDGIFSTVCN